LEGGIQRLRVGRLALDDLNEHGGASDHGGEECKILSFVDVTAALCQRQYTGMLNFIDFEPYPHRR
jgi:hypothetical protein